MNQGPGEGLLGDVFSRGRVSPTKAESADQTPIVRLVAIDEIGRREDAFRYISVGVGRIRLHPSHGGTAGRKRLLRYDLLPLMPDALPDTPGV
jgi:hypothetical protein